MNMDINKDNTMSKAATVLETIKKTKSKGGMTASQIALAEAQSEDYADMKREIQEIRTDIGDVKKEVSDVKSGLAEIKGSLNILLNEKKLTDNKYFWICIIIIMMLLAGVTHLSEIATLFGG